MPSEPKILVPDELHRRIIDSRDHIVRALEKTAQSGAEIKRELESLRYTRDTADKRAQSLCESAHLSEADAVAAVSAQNHAAAIRARLKKVEDQPAPGVDLGQAYGVIFSILYVWRDQNLQLIHEALAPFGIPPGGIPFISTYPVFTALDRLNTWLATVPPANGATVARALAIFDRALRGQVNLAFDEPETPNTTT